MLHLTCPNAKGQRPEGSMGRSVAVAADYRCARKGKALLRSDDVDYALALIPQSKVCQTESFDVFLECQTLYSGVGFFNELTDVFEVLSRRGGYVLRTLVGGIDNVLQRHT